MKLTKTSVLLILALLLSASFVLLNFGSSILFAGHIADFTADKRLSLRPETEKMLSEIKTPLTVRLYVSAGVEKIIRRPGSFPARLFACSNSIRMPQTARSAMMSNIPSLLTKFLARRKCWD